MILKEQNSQEIILGNVDAQMFSIDDSNAMIFDILRNKLYSNKIGSISREIASNSRDAHRESGTDKNIEIEFTNDNFLSAIGDTSIIFRDFGNGISPDRMENIFLKYGASSKRDSNLQTGGFGLGAKVPMSYTDSFVIKTTCDYAKPIIENKWDDWEDEEGVAHRTTISEVVGYEPVKRWEYTYNAIIDATGKGKMIKISELPTENHSGTEIIIPILSNDDRFKFEKEVYKYTMHWDKVTYINFKTDKPKIESIIEEKDFKITPYKDASFIGLLDGIPYEIKPEGQYISSHTVFLNLDLGKLTINANRESLQYDEITTKHVNEVYNLFKDRLEEIVKQFLSDNKTFLEAYDKLKKLKSISDCGDTSFSLFKTLRNSRFGSFDYNVSFNGEVVDKISLSHHSVVLVKWLGTASKYTQTTLSMDYPIVYLDKGGIRLPKNEQLDKFYLIKPDKSVAKDILEKEKQYLLDLGIKLINYSEVKVDKVYIKPAKNDKVKIYLRNYDNPHYDKVEYSFDKTLKTVLGLDPEKVLFLTVTDFRSYYSFRRGDFCDNKERVLKYKKEIKSIFYVNEGAFEKYLKPNGYKKVQEVYNTINLEEFSKYVEIDKIKSTVNKIPTIIKENFPEVLPVSIIKFMNTAQEEVPNLLRNIRWHNLGIKSSKFNYEGVVKKFEERLRTNYPLLPAYLNSHRDSEEEKIKNIKKYIELTKK